MSHPDKPDDETIQAAIEKSLLSSFPPELRQSLVQESIRVHVPAGTTLYYEEDEPRCGLVIRGLIRVYMTSPDGRQITVRYARAAELLGIAAIVGGPAPVSVQMLTGADLLMLNVRRLQDSARTEPGVGWLLAQEVTRRLYDTLEALAGNTFGSLQQHVARHLLDLAASRQQGAGLVVRVTQQELADAVGSVRPAVARILGQMREAGLLSTSSDGILLLKPDQIDEITWSREL